MLGAYRMRVSYAKRRPVAMCEELAGSNGGGCSGRVAFRREDSGERMQPACYLRNWPDAQPGSGRAPGQGGAGALDLRTKGTRSDSNVDARRRYL